MRANRARAAPLGGVSTRLSEPSFATLQWGLRAFVRSTAAPMRQTPTRGADAYCHGPRGGARKSWPCTATASNTVSDARTGINRGRRRLRGHRRLSTPSARPLSRDGRKRSGQAASQPPAWSEGGRRRRRLPFLSRLNGRLGGTRWRRRCHGGGSRRRCGRLPSSLRGRLLRRRLLG